MINIDPVLLTIIMFGSMLVLVALGLPIMFCLGGVAVVLILLVRGPGGLLIIASAAWDVMGWIVIIAIPLFVFMAMILQGSGVAEDLFLAMRRWAGRVPGGLAIGVVFICTMIAAMSGISTTGVMTMGLTALPLMLRLGYNKTMAIGPIMAGGALGILIPPSVSFVLYGAIAEVSIGRLFLGGIVPGLILSAEYIIYIAVRCGFNPALGPPLPPEERVSFKEKIVSMKSLVLPILLIMAVLGSIFLGVASPTEAAGVGAVGAIICALIYRKFNWGILKVAIRDTFKITVMVTWIIIFALTYKAIFVSGGGSEVVKDFMSGLGLEPILIIVAMQITYMFLGCFLDDAAILLITIPVYLPVVLALGFDPIWFGVLFIVNLQMAYLTPPFGFCLFYMRGVAPPEITMADIYRSILPFIPMQLLCLVLVLLFPQLALWLPDKVLGLLG